MCICFLSVCPQNVSPCGKDSLRLVTAVSLPGEQCLAPAGPSVLAAGLMGRAALLASPHYCQNCPFPSLLLSFLSLRNAQPPIHNSKHQSQRPRKIQRWQMEGQIPRNPRKFSGVCIQACSYKGKMFMLRRKQQFIKDFLRQEGFGSPSYPILMLFCIQLSAWRLRC